MIAYSLKRQCTSVFLYPVILLLFLLTKFYPSLSLSVTSVILVILSPWNDKKKKRDWNTIYIVNGYCTFKYYWFFFFFSRDFTSLKAFNYYKKVNTHNLQLQNYKRSERDGMNMIWMFLWYVILNITGIFFCLIVPMEKNIDSSFCLVPLDSELY